jgi:hypothetical protein
MAATKPFLTVEFETDRETKGTIRYKEDEPADGSRPAIGTLYITKTALAKTNGVKRIRVTVEAIG